MSNTQSTENGVSELDRVQLETWPSSNQMAFTVFQVPKQYYYIIL